MVGGGTEQALSIERPIGVLLTTFPVLRWPDASAVERRIFKQRPSVSGYFGRRVDRVRSLQRQQRALMPPFVSRDQVAATAAYVELYISSGCRRSAQPSRMSAVIQSPAFRERQAPGHFRALYIQAAGPPRSSLPPTCSALEQVGAQGRVQLLCPRIKHTDLAALGVRHNWLKNKVARQLL